MAALPFCHIEISASWKDNSAYPAELKSIGDHIRKRRLDKAMKQKDVAKTLGCTKDTVANWEMGRSNPRIDQMGKVIQFLGYDPSGCGDSVAQRLLAYRRLHGITQENLAARLSVDPCTLSRYEQNERIPYGILAHRIEDLLTRSRNNGSRD